EGECEHRGPLQVPGRGSPGRRGSSDRRRRQRRRRRAVRADRAGEPDLREGAMSREIMKLVHDLERGLGIEGDTRIRALEDALLAPYKKTPGSSRHAVVELD